MKKTVPIRPFWYSDVFLFPKLITIVTTLDSEGRINAGPYSHIMQYDVMHKHPRILLGFRNTSDTFKNIEATGEFVINCPSADYLEDMMETARFYPEGVNELEHTRFTMIPSQKVAPPSIAECGQIIECTVDRIEHLDRTQGHVIGNIEALVFDEELIDMNREERIRALNLPIGLGDEKRKYYYYSFTDRLAMYELQEIVEEEGAKPDIRTGMPWDSAALEALVRVPRGVRRMVIWQTERRMKKAGHPEVTLERFRELAREYGMDDEVLNRFETESQG